MTTFDIVTLVVIIVIALLLLRLMLRSMIGMMHHDRPTGSAAGAVIGAMAELDKAVRPSIEHVHQAKERAENQDHQDGE